MHKLDNYAIMHLKHKLYNLYIIDIKPPKYKLDNKCKKDTKDKERNLYIKYSKHIY